MADQHTVKPPGKHIPPVAEDNIWKDYIHKITKNQIVVWPKRWQWLVDENEKMHKAMAGKRLLSPYDVGGREGRGPAEKPQVKAAELSDTKGDKPAAPVAAAKTLKTRKLDIVLPPVPAMPPQTTIPVTTSGWCGYLPKLNGRSVVSDRQKWCKVTVGQHNLPKVFGWPDVFD